MRPSGEMTPDGNGIKLPNPWSEEREYAAWGTSAGPRRPSGAPLAMHVAQARYCLVATMSTVVEAPMPIVVARTCNVLPWTQ